MLQLTCINIVHFTRPLSYPEAQLTVLVIIRNSKSIHSQEVKENRYYPPEKLQAHQDIAQFEGEA